MRYSTYVWILFWCILTVIMSNYLGTFGSIMAIVTGFIAIISVIVVIRRWWRIKHAPWDMYMIFRGKKCKKVTIDLDDKPIEENMRVIVKIKQPTIPVAICLVDDLPIRFKGWQVPHWLITLLRLRRRGNASEDCGLLIPKIENNTWTGYSQATNPEPIPGLTVGHSQGIMWNLRWGGRPAVFTNYSVDLQLTLLVTKPWEGDLEFSGEVDSERRLMARRIKVKRIDSKTQVADKEGSQS